MKTLTLAVVLLAAVVAASAKDCRKPEDCGENECCVEKKFSIFGRGKCKPLAKEGDKCSTEDEKSIFREGLYSRYCPCSEPFKCIPEKEEETVFGTIKINPRCKVETEGTTSEPEVETPTTQEEVATE